MPQESLLPATERVNLFLLCKAMLRDTRGRSWTPADSRWREVQIQTP